MIDDQTPDHCETEEKPKIRQILRQALNEVCLMFFLEVYLEWIV